MDIEIIIFKPRKNIPVQFIDNNYNNNLNKSIITWIPHLQTFSENLRRVSNEFNIKTVFKITLTTILTKTKQKNETQNSVVLKKSMWMPHKFTSVKFQVFGHKKQMCHQVLGNSIFYHSVRPVRRFEPPRICKYVKKMGSIPYLIQTISNKNLYTSKATNLSKRDINLTISKKSDGHCDSTSWSIDSEMWDFKPRKKYSSRIYR